MHRLADRLTPAPQCTSTPVTPCNCVKLLLVMTWEDKLCTGRKRTLIAEPCFLDVVIRGVEIGCDVLCVYISHCHLQMLETFRNLQIFWVIVNADDPAT